MLYIRDYIESKDGLPEEAFDFDSLEISKNALEKIVEYCKYAYDHGPPSIKKPIEHRSLFDVTSPWYANFVNAMNDDFLCEMILAANNLNIPPLQDLLSAKLAIILKDKTV